MIYQSNINHSKQQVYASYNMHRQALEQQYLRGLIPSTNGINAPMIPVVMPSRETVSINPLYSQWLDGIAEIRTIEEYRRNTIQDVNVGAFSTFEQWYGATQQYANQIGGKFSGSLGGSSPRYSTETTTTERPAGTGTGSGTAQTGTM